MSRLSETKTALKWQISEHLDLAFKRLEEVLWPNSIRFNEYIQIRSRYSAYLNTVILGISSKDELDANFNQLSHALLLFVDQLQDDDVKPEFAHPTPASNKHGELLYHIPGKMQTGCEYRCIVRLAFLKDILFAGWKNQDGEVQMPVRIAEIMSVELLNLNESEPFVIRTLNDAVQFLEKDDFTEWQFYVKPRRAGEFELALKVAMLEIRNGREVKKDAVMEQHVVVTTEMPAVIPEQFEKSNIQLTFNDLPHRSIDDQQTRDQVIAPQESEKTRKTVRTSALFLALAVVGITAMMIVLHGMDHSNIASNVQKEAFSELETVYRTAMAQLEQQKGLNAELDETINIQMQELMQNKAQIEQLIHKSEDYKPALANLAIKKDHYLVEIERLKIESGILQGQFTPRNKKDQEWDAHLAEVQQRLDEENARRALISEKTQLEIEKDTLRKKVEMASAIRVGAISVTAESINRKVTTKANKTTQFKICFLAEANEIVEAGEEIFYITIIDPTGILFASDSIASNKPEFRFTTIANCKYRNEKMQMCTYWKPDLKLAKGKYMAEIFNKGYQVGRGTFFLY